MDKALSTRVIWNMYQTFFQHAKAVELAKELDKKKVDVDKSLAQTPCIFCGKPVAYVECMERALCQEHSDCEKRVRKLLIEVLQKEKKGD